VRAELPVAARSGYGPHATALAGLLHGRYRLSVRETSAVLEDVCGLPMSESSVVTSCVRVSAALEPVYQHVRDTVAQQPVSNIDETSWQELGHRRWLWVFVTAVATLFQVAQGRGKAVWRDVMGTAYGGILGSDRLAAYNAHPIDRRQVCWAHLQRNLRAIEERGGVVGAWANETLTWVQMLFTIWHTFRDDHKDRAMLQAAMEPVQDGLWDCLQRGREVPWSKARALSGEMLRLWDGLWTFVEVVGVEPTNNVAERALRPAVLWRKGSFGTQSVAGSRFVERMLTVRETCRQQQIHILAFLTEAVQAHWHGTPAPQLIPPP
jgi:transposase